LSSLAHAGVVGSIPAPDIYVCLCLFCFCVDLCLGGGLLTGSYTVKGVLSTVCRTQKPKKRPRSNKGYKAIDNKLLRVSNQIFYEFLSVPYLLHPLPIRSPIMSSFPDYAELLFNISKHVALTQ
jgi:hypothetical protein